MSLREYQQRTTAQDWQPVGKRAALAVTVLAVYLLWQHLATADQWVFLLDHANLAIHEAGHPIVRIFSNRWEVYGGTIFQLLFPLLFVHHFWRHRQTVGFAASGLWLGESLLNVARYMKDARAQQLPLVGGGQHDWAEIFSRWNVLGSDVQIGRFFTLVAVSICLIAVGWLWTMEHKSR